MTKVNLLSLNGMANPLIFGGAVINSLKTLNGQFWVINEAILSIVILLTVTKSSRWSGGNGNSIMATIRVTIDLCVFNWGRSKFLHRKFL